VYIDVTLTRSKVKVKVTGLLNSDSETVHAGGDDRSPLPGLSGSLSLIVSELCDTR